MNLEEIRQEIDHIDQELVRLLEARMDCVSQVVAYKQEHGLKVLDQDRENRVLEKVANRVSNEIYKETICRQFQDLMARSREFQAGVKGSD